MQLAGEIDDEAYALALQAELNARPRRRTEASSRSAAAAAERPLARGGTRNTRAAAAAAERHLRENGRRRRSAYSDSEDDSESDSMAKRQAQKGPKITLRLPGRKDAPVDPFRRTRGARTGEDIQGCQHNGSNLISMRQCWHEPLP